MDEWTETGDMRPLRVGEILSRTWDLLRRDILLYLKIAVVPALGFLLIDAAFLWPMHRAGVFPPATHPSPPDVFRVMTFLASAIVLLPFAFAIYAIYEGAVCSRVLAAMRGERSGFADCYRAAGRRAGSLIWVMFLRTAAAMLPWIALMIAAAGAGVLGNLRGEMRPGTLFVFVPLLVLLYLGGIVWAVWITLHFSMGSPACMAEDLTGWQALKRSGQLSRGGKWRMLGAMFLVYLIGMAAVIVLEIAGFALLGVGAIAGIALHLQFTGTWQLLWAIPLVLVLLAALYVILGLQYASFSVALTVLYQDQRFRHGGTLVLPLSS